VPPRHRGARPFTLLSSCYLSACSSCCDSFQSSFCFGWHRCSFCSDSSSSSSGSSPICSGPLHLVRCGCRPCFSCFFRRCRFQLRPWLSGGGWQRPSGQQPSATLSIAKLRLCARLCGTRSWCSSSPDPIHSSCRRRLPCSPSPKRAVPPHVVKHHASRSLLRCVRLSAAACWCKTTCHPVAWS
jgi:hypothetical protein